jgi:succinate-acetate transporter protein
VSHREQTRIMLRPIGSGLPLGFFSFGIGMLLLGCSGVGWIPVAEQKDVGMMLMAFVFPLEAIATIVAFLARDTVGATTLGLFTTSWLSLGWADQSSPPGTTSVTLGIYLFGFGTAALLLGLMSIRSKPFFSALLAIATTRMVLSGVYEIGGGTHWYRISGGFGIALCALAFYGGVALGLEDVQQAEVLPLFRIGKARAAFDSYEEQLEPLANEPGVRHQL